jgi:hypothetical protein
MLSKVQQKLLLPSIMLYASLAANPWDKYMLAPGPNRTQFPIAWTVTPAGKTPPQPGGGNCGGDIGGKEGEWGGTPGKKGAQMKLSCESGSITGVKFASFGEPTGTCGSYKKGSCDAANTTSWVSALCVGKTSCTIPPDTTVRNTHSPLVQALGDPCPEKEKFLAVQLTGCSTGPPNPPPTLPVTLSGKGDSIMFDWGQETGESFVLHFIQIMERGGGGGWRERERKKETQRERAMSRCRDVAMSRCRDVLGQNLTCLISMCQRHYHC